MVSAFRFFKIDILTVKEYLGMKLIAMYLPQFHEIEENNRAWGKGFTEWDNVRKAKPLFDGHDQPREPLNDNYYNLLDIRTLEWQSELAKMYGIYGFCFYHYWFRDGKHVLEKPSELLLRHTEIDLPFCFSWANEPWTKTWHGAAGEKEVLIEQRYGAEQQWKEHFEYLLPFFQDARYIKVENKPMFLIYQIHAIGCFGRMMECWEKMAVENGFAGIYIVDMLTVNGKVCKGKWVNANVEFEPSKILGRLKRTHEGLAVYDYDEACKEMLKVRHRKNSYRSVFAGYDDSPRRGGNGTIFQGQASEKFGKYLQKTIRLSESEDNDIVFINAWNEWGESNYLEPDKKDEYGYLEAVQKALMGEYPDIEIEMAKEKDPVTPEDKFRAYFEVCNQWLKIQNDGYSVESFFKEKGYKKIAIYGVSELGNRLAEALVPTEIEVVYGIDRNVCVAFSEIINIKGLEEEKWFDGIDCIVVTPVHVFEEVGEALKRKSDCDIVSLEEVIYSI